MIPVFMPHIDYGLLAAAISAYTKLGYQQIEVPWITSIETVDATQPVKSRRFAVDDGHLVGSAEQGFLELAARGYLNPGKFMAVTPCFRDEKVENRWTQRWFMKLELWDTVSASYLTVLNDALGVMRTLTPHALNRCSTGDGCDITKLFDRKFVEVGSYGHRRLEVYGRMVEWNYGTGLALPRFTTS